MVANVIYRGPAEREPETVMAVTAGGYMPGLVVTYTNGGTATQAANAKGRWGILGNSRFLGQSVDTAYGTGDSCVVYRVEGDQEYNARLAIGTYTPNQELTVSAGTFKAAVATDVVVAVFDEKANRTLSAIGLGDVVLLSVPYVK